MKKIALVLMMVVMVSAPAFAGDYHFTWDDNNTKLHVPLTVLWVADTMQTVYIAEHPNEFYEAGWAQRFIGSHPSREEVYAYFAGTYALTTFVVWALPPKWSHAVQHGAIGIEAYVVSDNIFMGVGFQF